MQITPLASGSSGNSFLIQSNGSALLVDAGLSGKQIVQRLEKVGFDPASLAGILVSHGHSDHIKGVGVLSRKFKLPVWMNRGTWEAIEDQLGKVHELKIFETGRVFVIAGFRVHPFSVPARLRRSRGIPNFRGHGRRRHSDRPRNTHRTWLRTC